MPKIVSDLTALVTLKPCKPLGKRVNLIPGQPLEVTETELKHLFDVDQSFRWYVENACIEVQGGSLPEGMKLARRMPPGMTPPHRPGPTTGVRDPGQKPPPSTPRDTAPIEPTPMGGVPGTAKQAMTSIYASTDIDQLEAWKGTETRKSVLKVIDERVADIIEEASAPLTVEDDGSSHR